jgi:serine/threonine protein kinase
MGVSAYEMLRGHRPFPMDKTMSTYSLHNMLMTTRPSASANWDVGTCEVLKMVSTRAETLVCGIPNVFTHFLQLLHPEEKKRLQSVSSMKKLAFFKDILWKEVEKKTVVPPFIPPVSSLELCGGLVGALELGWCEME